MTKEFKIEDFKKGENYVITASAGTGKTYNIVEIVKKLLSEDVPLEKILLVTYTEKAAGELKDRIRKGIDGLGIEADVDSAPIGTIHSFCQKTIEEFCISSGKPSSLILIDENCVEEFIDRYIREPEIYKTVCELKNFNLDKKVEDTIKKKFNAILGKYYLSSEGKEVESIVSLEDYDKDLIDFWEKYVIKKQSLDTIFPEYNQYLEVLNSSSIPELNQLYSILKGSRTFGFNKTDYSKKRGWSTEEKDAFEWICKFKGEKSKKLTTFKDGNRNLNKFINYYSKDLYLKWQEEKANKSQQTFNDMLRNVREEVVKKGLLLERLKEKYSYAIIDEFQDTNQIQWDIFREVFMCEGHNIIVVGDPKQSIYSFQGADVKVFIKATEEIIKKGGKSRVLKTNYRSTENIVKNINTFFENKIAIEDFEPSKASDKKFDVQLDGNPIKSIWIYDGKDNKDNDENKRKFAEIVCQKIIEYCSYTEKGTTRLRIFDEDGKPHNVSFGSFAVLSRTRPEMTEMVKAFEKCGIPYVKYKDNSLFQGKECASWIALLDAINAPDFTGNNRKKFKKALFSLFFNYSMKDISSPEYDKDNIPEIGVFEKWRAIANESRWEDLIDEIIADTNLEGNMQSLKLLKSLGTMKQLADYCIDYLSAGHNLNMLINNLTKSSKNINDEEADGTVARSTDFDCVKVMTIHASKGLEFPIVISSSGANGMKPSQVVYDYHDGDGKFKLALDKPDGYNAEKIEEWKRIYYVAYTRAKYMLMLPRYSYQANKDGELPNHAFIGECISDYMAKGADGYGILEDKRIDIEELKKSVRDILTVSDKDRLKEGKTERDSQIEILKDLKNKRYFHSSYKHAYSSLSHDDKKEKTIISDDSLSVDNAEEITQNNLSAYDESAKMIVCDYELSLDAEKLSSDFPAGAGLGNALHDIFEEIDYHKLPDDSEYTEFIRTKYKMQGLKPSDNWVSDTKKMVENVIEAKLPVIHGSMKVEDGTICLKELTFDDRKNETEFNFNKDEHKLHHFFNGFIDLVFRKDGYYSIVDWKSDRLNDHFTKYNDAEVIKRHVDELYSIQRVLYAYTLIHWLKNFYDIPFEEIFEKHFGGVYYVFLRGCNSGTGNGIYAQTWENYSDLEEAYKKIVRERVGK